MQFYTADLYDRFGARARVPCVLFENFGARMRFSGEIVTVKCFEDNSRIKELSVKPGHGKVLVVDGGGSLRCALMGDQIALDAAANGWRGAIILGCVRDREALRKIELGIKALGSMPRKSIKHGEGQVGSVLEFGGIEWRPGDMIFADEDGVVVLDPADAEKALKP